MSIISSFPPPTQNRTNAAAIAPDPNLIDPASGLPIQTSVPPASFDAGGVVNSAIFGAGSNAVLPLMLSPVTGSIPSTPGSSSSSIPIPLTQTPSGGFTGQLPSVNPLVNSVVSGSIVGGATGAASGIVGASSNANPSSITWAPNSLSSFQNYTYNIRLLMAPERVSFGTPDQIRTQLEDKNTPIVILFESGATGFNIKELIIESMGGFNSHSRNATATSFRMTVVEPMNISLLDNIINSAQKLGIINYSKAPYYLEIKFMGYDDNGNEITAIPAPDVTIRRWMVFIQNIVTKFDAGGAHHEITLVPYDQVSMSNHYGTTSSPIKIDNKATMAEFFSEYAKKLTENSAANSGLSRDKYKIIVDPILNSTIAYANSHKNPGTWKILSDQSTSEQRTGSNIQINSQHATIERNLAIEEVAMHVWAATEEGAILMQRKSSDAATDKEDMIIVPKVKSISRIRRDDPYSSLANNYNLEIEYHIVPNETPRGYATVDDIRPQLNPSESFAIAQQRYNKNRLVKRYDWLFTGLNTEVLDVNLTFNTAYYMVVATYGGLGSPASVVNNATVTSKRDPYYLNRQSLTNISPTRRNTLIQARQLLTIQQQNPGQDITQIPDAMAIINNIRSNPAKLAELQFTPAQISQIEKNAALDAPLQQGNFSDIPPMPVGLESNGIPLTPSQAIAQRLLAAGQTETAKQAEQDAAIGNKLINETVVSLGGLSKYQYAELMADQINDQKSYTLPVTLESTLPDVPTNTSGRVQGRIEPNQLIVSAILQQLYTSAPSGDLIRILLSIRGDPYWLGATNLSTDTTAAGSYFTYQPNKNYWNEEAGEHMLVLSFQFPQGLDDSGNVVLNKTNLYSGLYVAVKITSHFTDGVFKQEIDAVRDSIINVDQITAANPAPSSSSNGSNPSSGPLDAFGNGQGGAGGAFSSAPAEIPTSNISSISPFLA